MKLDQFMIDYWRESDEITVQCLWLQKQLVSNSLLEETIYSLKKQLEGQKHLNDRLKVQIELAQIEKPIRLDERA